MRAVEMQQFLHDLNNHLNSANLNTTLLKSLHGTSLDAETMQRLDSALQNAAKLTREFQGRLQEEITSVSI
jgi:hypothetical protein